MNKAHVREATEADLPAVAEMWTILDAFHRQLGFDFPHPRDAADRWLASFRRTLGRFSFLWLAETGDRPAAFLLARVKQSPAYLGSVQIGEISDLYVNDELRSSGIGAELVDVAVIKFRELKVHSIEVQVQAGNRSGLGFWYKQGFTDDLNQVRMHLRD